MNKTVLITGASSGIGLAFCEEYAKQGYQVILVSRSEKRLEEIKNNLIAKYQIEAHVLVSDLAQKGAALNLYEAVKKQNWSLDVLINNAGFSNNGLFSTIPFEKTQEEMHLNIVSLTELTHLFVADMLVKRTGTIINIASIASFYPAPYASVYAASKAYVLSFTEGLNKEYGPQGIKFLSVSPGVTRTNFFADKTALGSRSREPNQVVQTTMNALYSNKAHVVDGFRNRLQSWFPRFLSRKQTLVITASVGKKLWG